MKLLGICTKSIEQLEKDLEDNEVALTYWEFMDLYEKKQLPNKNIIICDCLSKLLLINDLKMADVFYSNYSWKKLQVLDKEYKEMGEELSFQQRVFKDFDLGEHSYITHLTEYQKDVYGFCLKIHNILSQTAKEKIECADEYKEKMKENLINAETSRKYKEFLEKKAGNYPEIFKFMRTILNSVYKEGQERSEEE